MNYKERLVLYGSYAIACTVPWIAFKGWIFAHTTSKAFIFYGVTSIIAAVWVYLYSVDIRYRFTKKELMLVVPLVLYVLWMTVSSIAAKNSAFAVWGTLMRGTGLLTLYATFLYTIIIFSLSKRHEGYIQRFTSLSVFAGIVVLLSIWFGDEGFNIAIGVLQKGSGGGVTGNSTIAGAYFLFVLGFTAFLIAIKDSVKKTWLWLFAICIICSPLFINVYGFLNHKGILGSARGAFGGIIIAAMVAGLVYLTLSSKRLLQILGIAGVVVGIVISCIVWSKLVTPGTVVHEKFIDAASGTRFAFWNISQKVMNERPFVGYGPENFSIAQARYFNPQFLSKNLAFEAWTDHPHNVYYDNGVAGGYPGIFFYALFVGSLIVIVYKNTKLSPAQRSILIGTIAGYVIQNLVAVEGFMTIFMLATSAGMIYGLTTSVSIQKPKCVRGWYVYIYVILCITGLFGAYQFGYLPAQKAKLFAEVLGSKLNERYPRYQEFLKGSPVGNYWDVSGFGYDEYKLYAQNPLAVKQDPKLLSHAIKDVDAYITYLEQVAQTNKTDYRLYFTIINLYNTKIYFSDLPYDPVLAARITSLIDYASTLAPTDPRLYWMRAQLAAWKGDLAGVVGAYQKAIAIDPTLPVSHKLLIQFLQGVGNQKLYKEALDAAQKDIPGFTMQ